MKKTYNQILMEQVSVLNAFMDDSTQRQLHKATMKWLSQHRPETTSQELYLELKTDLEVKKE